MDLSKCPKNTRYKLKVIQNELIGVVGDSIRRTSSLKSRVLGFIPSLPMKSLMWPTRRNFHLFFDMSMREIREVFVADYWHCVG